MELVVPSPFRSQSQPPPSAPCTTGSGQTSYVVPRWIQHGGRYRNDGGKIDLTAFDPEAPYTPRGNTFALRSNPLHRFEDPFDLRNLRFMDPDKPQRVLEQMEKQVRGGEQRVVGIINTGGTIATTYDNNNVLIPTLSVEDLVEEAGGRLGQRFVLAGEAHQALIDSSQQEVDLVADLAIALPWIYKNASLAVKRVFHGFLIPHGTDTIDAAAPYLAMMLGPDCPFSVGFVGAQRSRSARYSDVAANLRLACDTLDHLKDDTEQVTAIFVVAGGTGGGAYPAVGCVKVSEVLTSFLSAPAHPKIVVYDDSRQSSARAYFERAYHRRDFFRPLILRGCDQTLEIQARMGASVSDIARVIAASAAPAVLLKSFGSFTVNEKMLTAMEQACKDHGKMFFAMSPFPGGRTDQHYEATVHLRQSSATVVSMLPGPFNAKLHLAIAAFGQDKPADIAHFMSGHNYFGEQTEWFNYESGALLKPKDTLGTPQSFYDDMPLPDLAQAFGEGI